MTLQNQQTICDPSLSAVVELVPMNDLSNKSKEELLKMIDSLKKENEELKNYSPKPYEKMSDESIKECVKKFIEKIPDGAEVSPLDISDEFNIDPDDVERIMDIMTKEGYFK